MPDSPRPFVHLHCHSHYSLLDGASQIGALVERAKELGMNGLALTDHGNLHGALEFYKKAKDGGINPILGYEAYIAPGSRFEKKDAGSSKEASYHLTLLAQNRTGFKNLIKLASAGVARRLLFQAADRQGTARGASARGSSASAAASRASSAARSSSGGGRRRGFARRHARSPPGFAACSASATSSRSRTTAWKSSGWRWRRPSRWPSGMGMPLVATSDAHYVNREDAEAQDVLLCINTGKFRTDTNRMRMEGDQFYPAQRRRKCTRRFPGLEEAVARSQEIADSVDIELELGKRHFPTFQLPAGKDGRGLSARAVRRGPEGAVRRRRRDAARAASLSPVVHRAARARAGGHQQAGLSQLLSDRVGFRAAMRASRAFRPRPAAAASARSCRYALYLSHVCPLKYDLLFERFLDESRKEAPDIDIDFCKDRRGEVIRYVKEKYGEENVAQIGTFGTLAARAAIRDVGRALGMPDPARRRSSWRWCPRSCGITLDEALEAERRPEEGLRHRRRSPRSCSTWPRRSRAWRATSARTPPRW